MRNLLRQYASKSFCSVHVETVNSDQSCVSRKGTGSTNLGHAKGQVAYWHWQYWYYYVTADRASKKLRKLIFISQIRPSIKSYHCLFFPQFIFFVDFGHHVRSQIICEDAASSSQSSCDTNRISNYNFCSDSISTCLKNLRDIYVEKRTCRRMYVQSTDISLSYLMLTECSRPSTVRKTRSGTSARAGKPTQRGAAGKHR